MTKSNSKSRNSRRQPTDEQKAKAAERREQFKRIAKAVSAMTDEQRRDLVDRCGAVVNCEARPLSLYNTCLLLTQNPTVSMVGGFRQWQSAGRQVRKGEHGLAIWIPTGIKQEPEDGDEEDGVRFIMGTVFDVSQTDEILVEQAA